MPLLIKNATLVLPETVVPRGYLMIDGDRIAALGQGDPPEAGDLRLETGESSGQSPISNPQSPISNLQSQL